MTVQELINELQQLDPNAEIHGSYDSNMACAPIAGVFQADKEDEHSSCGVFEAGAWYVEVAS